MPRWANNGTVHISGKNHYLRHVEGLLEAECQALYDGEREKMIKFAFRGQGQNYHFWGIWSETAIVSYFREK